MILQQARQMNRQSKRPFFEVFSTTTANAAGRPLTFVVALHGIGLWAVLGPVFHFSETWQLVVNTGTTIITFLMVFVLQNSQNRDGEAIQAKLDELIRVSAGTDRLIGAEHLSQEELQHIREVIDNAARRHDQRQAEANRGTPKGRANRRSGAQLPRQQES
jgi:low affinity Fe/Cu permease